MKPETNKLRNENGVVVDETGDAVCARCGGSRRELRRLSGCCWDGREDHPYHIWKWQLEEQP